VLRGFVPVVEVTAAPTETAHLNRNLAGISANLAGIRGAGEGGARCEELLE
jgi:hypothetical protein